MNYNYFKRQCFFFLQLNLMLILLLIGCMNEDTKKEATIKRGEELTVISKEDSVSIKTDFLTLNEIEITKEERFNTSNNLSEDDSISFTKTNYLINEEGEIIEIK